MVAAAIDHPAPKRAYRIRELKPLGGPGHDKAYRLIGEGKLRAVKQGRSTLILADDFETYLKSLTPIQPKAPARTAEPVARAPRRRRVRGKRG